MCCWKNYKRRTAFAVAGLALLMALRPLIAAAEPAAGRLAGTYRFHGRSLIDPPPGEANDTHLGLVLEGPVARDLFRRMTANAEEDLCLDDGSVSKTEGGLRCTELAGKPAWRCEFAIQLDTQTLVADGAC